MKLSKVDTKYEWDTWSYSVQIDRLSYPIALHIAWKSSDDPPKSLPPSTEEQLFALSHRVAAIFLDEWHPWAVPAYLMYIVLELSSEFEIDGWLFASLCDAEGTYWEIHFADWEHPQALEISCYGGNHTGDSGHLKGLLPDHPLLNTDLVDEWTS